jgi:hypothetical protein
MREATQAVKITPLYITTQGGAPSKDWVPLVYVNVQGGVAAPEMTLYAFMLLLMIRIGQNHIYTVFTRHFWQGNWCYHI